MRRFSRRKRGGSSSEGAAPIDAGRWLSRINEAGIESAPLEAMSHEEVPEDFAALGQGERDDGTRVVVSFSPEQAGDALFAALATGQRLAEQDGGFAGEVLAIAPVWSLAARRRLGLMKAELPFRLRTLSPTGLAETGDSIEAESALDPNVVPVAQVVAQVADAGVREVFGRATAALEGLAAKHGGSIRGVGDTVELVLVARRVARLEADAEGVTLETLAPQRASVRLGGDELSVALDGLEGQLRRRLNDRRVRDSEEGLRNRVVPLLVKVCQLRDPLRWPEGGSDRDEIDVVGLDETGRPVIAMVRRALSLKALGPMLDAVQRMRLALPGLFAASMPPVLLQTPRVVIAAEEYSVGALRVLSSLSLAHDLYELRAGHERGNALAPIESAEAARSLAEKAPRSRRRRSGRGRPQREEEKADSVEPAATAELEEGEDKGEGREEAAPTRGRGGRKRGRRRGGRDRQGEASDRAAAGSEDTASGEQSAEAGSQSGFEEVSLFDLDDGADSEEAGGGKRRGRGRRRGRPTDDGGSEPSVEEAGGDRGGRKGRGRGKQVAVAATDTADAEDSDDEDVVEDDLDSLAELPEELEAEPAKKRFGGAGGADDEDDEEEEPVIGGDEANEVAVKAPVIEIVPEKKQPRRRAAVVALADRDSVFAAVLLCRDIRLLDGLWVYPQSELMNFFREVATDLREDCPIYLIGFTPSPAMDVLQAAALYSDRLVWFDHHEWPPEDHAAVRDLIGEESLNYAPGVGSSMPLVLETCSRRSRFTDKLVDLAAGRFTQHDFERWGRLWWSRVGEIAKKSGDAKGDIGPLLAGRPSDLAKEAARLDAPAIPEEVDYAASRDFRLVYFAGYAMAIVDIDGDYDPQLTARVVRERYEAPLSLSYRKGSDLFLLAGDELSGRRAFELGNLTDHLAQKLEWVDSLPDSDRVARFRVRDLDANPERLTELISEIAMGRSILEG